MDAGSGTGITSRAIAKDFNFNVVSVDYLQHFTNIANQLNALCGLQNKITAIQGDMTSLDLEANQYVGKFDAVISIQAFLHIRDKKALFTLCNKALKNGGMLYIEDFTVHDKSILQEDDTAAMEHLGLHNIDQ
mmetsp:Transcript_808/g.108  ORF Transcript_808/g.108 Transcript_808/m.108 type:complete len:133 (+) Transcript_808:211-609(+)